tara:strand:+ start:188 stop:352 length:165 start_codon:yes stop_codon:yes gene_type:complete
MKLKFLRTSTVGNKSYTVGETAEVNKDSALILIQKGRAKEVQDKSKTAKSNKED